MPYERQNKEHTLQMRVPAKGCTGRYALFLYKHNNIIKGKQE